MSAAASRPRSVTVRVPAKVNVELRVGPRRADGYHDVATIFMAVALYDEVTVTPADEWQVSVHGADADLVPLGEDNLAVRAAQLLAEDAWSAGPVRIRIHKEIPVAGGMAGGSADAAATLVACDQLWGLRQERDALAEVAAGLGADVPFPLVGGVAMGSGRGDLLTSVLSRGSYHWVFATSDAGLSTPEVYAEYDRLHADAPPPAPAASQQLLAALAAGDAVAVGAALRNDLQPAAVSLRPSLAEVLEAGAEFGALGAVVSGSGPTVAFLTGSSEAALDLCVALTATGMAGDVKRARGPVHGAHIAAQPLTP